MKIIINADDFGINQRVTEAIIEGIKNKLISSTTIMANGVCLSEAKEFSLCHSEISFGIHYCLSEFESLTKPEIFLRNGLIDKNGFFIKKAIFKIKYIDDTLRNAIYDELCSQTEKLISLGFSISHADSHHHVHTIPILKDIFISVMLKYGINKVRLPRSYRLLSAIRHPFSYMDYLSLRGAYKNKFKTVDYFASYKEYVQKPVIRDTVELMCHPGHPGSIYCHEMDLLKKKSLIDLCEYQLISYKDI